MSLLSAIKGLWKKEQFEIIQKDTRLKKLYTLRVDGKKVPYYTYSNLMNMPKERALMASVYMRWADMNVTKDSLRLMLNSVKELQDKGKLSDAGTVVNEILVRLDYYCEEETLMNLAAVYSVRKGEDPTVFSEALHEQKKKEIGSSRAAKGFFLAFALHFTNHSLNDYEGSTLQYLEEVVNPIVKNSRLP